MLTANLHLFSAKHKKAEACCSRAWAYGFKRLRVDVAFLSLAAARSWKKPRTAGALRVRHGTGAVPSLSNSAQSRLKGQQGTTHWPLQSLGSNSRSFSEARRISHRGGSSSDSSSSSSSSSRKVSKKEAIRGFWIETWPRIWHLADSAFIGEGSGKIECRPAS